MPTPPPEPFAEEIAAFDREDRAGLPPPGAILFLGSSTLRLMWNTHESFPDRPVINRGFGGSRIEDCIRAAPRIVLPLRPGTVVFYAGDNDLAEGKRPDQVVRNFRQLAGFLRESLPGVRILFLSIKPSPCREHLLEAVRQANGGILDWMNARTRLDYVDVFSPMLDAGGRIRSELFSNDMLHMNEDGYALWARILRPALEPG